MEMYNNVNDENLELSRLQEFLEQGIITKVSTNIAIFWRFSFEFQILRLLVILCWGKIHTEAVTDKLKVVGE